jgi:uncharacterized membrane protein YcaP (DUF421 family)
MSLQDVFGGTGELTWLQECARAALIFFYGLFLFRIAGRRAFAKWSALDIIVSIVVGSNLSRALTGPVPLGGTLAATTLMMFLHWLFAKLAARSSSFSRLVEGSSVQLAQAGAVAREVLVKHAVSDADLIEAVRSVGLDDTSKTRVVIPSGKISVLK